MGQVMKLKNLYFVSFFYFLLILIILDFIFFLLPRSYFGDPDFMVIWYWIISPIKYGHEHLDFLGLLRTGGLLNIPFYYFFKFNFLALRYLCVFLLLLSGLISYWGWIGRFKKSWKDGFKDPLCPLFVLMTVMTAGASYRFLLDYYSVPTIFLMMGLGFWLRANFYPPQEGEYKIRPYSFFMAALCFGLVSMGSSVSLVLSFGLVFVLAVLNFYSLNFESNFKSRGPWIFLVVSWFFIISWAWFYYIHWGVLNLIHYDALYYIKGIASPRAFELFELFKIIIASSLFFLPLLFICIVLNLIPVFLKQRFLILIFILSGLGLLITELVSLCDIFQHFDPDLCLLFFSAGLSWSLYLISLDFLNKNLKITYLILILLIFGFAMAVTSGSLGSGVMFLYLPLIFMWNLGLLRLVQFITQPASLKLLKLLNFLQLFISVIILGLVIMVFYNNHFFHNKLNIFNNKINLETYLGSDFSGIKINPVEAEYFKNIQDSYQKYHCQNKALLAFYDLPEVYVLTGREAMKDSAWIVTMGAIPESKKAQGELLLSDLEKSKTGWCVYYQAVPKFYIEPRTHENLVLKYIQQEGTHKIILKDSEKRHAYPFPVFLWVK